jgi:hypothetical protein
MAVLPRQSIKVEVFFMDGEPAIVEDDLPATPGGWHVTVHPTEGHALSLTGEDEYAEGIPTIGEAFTLVEKWATDRRMTIREGTIVLYAYTDRETK